MKKKGVFWNSNRLLFVPYVKVQGMIYPTYIRPLSWSLDATVEFIVRRLRTFRQASSANPHLEDYLT